MPNLQARRLRRDPTEAEERLWHMLRSRQLGGHKFRRQHPIGCFIVDFACVGARLVVEADGGQHADSESDRRRTGWLESQGWRVIRFWNNEICANPDGVIEVISSVLNRCPHPPR